MHKTVELLEFLIFYEFDCYPLDLQGLRSGSICGHPATVHRSRASGSTILQPNIHCGRAARVKKSEIFEAAGDESFHLDQFVVVGTPVGDQLAEVDLMRLFA